jgi:hypothetical protein
LAETIKSALLVDYESLHRSLADANGVGETRLADRASAWVAAVETGRLIGPHGTKRRLTVKRCYAGPNVLGKQRNSLSAAGFEVIDVAGADGSRGGVDMHLAIDTIDLLAQPNGPEEFLILTASSELAPLLTRLKASKRSAAIYADSATSAGDKALADATLDRTLFAEFLVSDEIPASEEKSAKSAADRAEIEAFARKIHAATNIPLFSPKTFAELFKHLTDEIRENGYHFQTTAKNVADRMTETGRQVTRRQVVFIVKGLALKGHVFSTTDTPDDLAEVFREQARYLITNAGLTIDENQERLLNAWFISRAQTSAPVSPAPVKTSVSGQNGSRPAATQPDQRPAPDRAPPVPQPPRTVEEKPPAAALAPEKPFVTAKSPPAFVKPVELPKSTAKPAAPKPSNPPPTAPVKAPPSPAAREEAKAVIAARIAASAKLKPGPRPATKPARAAASQPPKPTPSRKPAPEPAPDELENSILAAIAEAVDVLVDDGARQDAKPEPPPARDQQSRRKPGAAAPKAAPGEPEPAPAPEPASDDADIGDQIQRIIASYNRNRSDE